MNRLTERTKDGYVDKEECVITACSDKLGALEDVEEELGIDLITLFKALKNGIWFRPNKNKPHKREVWLRIKNNKWVLVYRTYTIIEIKDYKKTWALTKEELSCS